MFMNNKKDPMEQIIVDDLLKEAAAIDEEVPESEMDPMPEGLEEKIKQNIYAKMEAMEKERLYAQLSEEDKKALELGRKMLENPNTSGAEEKVVRYRKRMKMYHAVAAVAILVLAMGITSIGGPERVIEMMKSVVGEREVVKVNTSEDNYIVEIDKEEEAYQKIRDAFGIEAVKPTHWPKGTVFVAAEIDEKLQMALLKYECNDKVINYYISSQFMTGSWGIDVENELTDSYIMKVDEISIEVKEYTVPESQEKMFSAKYLYEGLDYFMAGIMERSEFELIIKNLKIF